MKLQRLGIIDLNGKQYKINGEDIEVVGSKKRCLTFVDFARIHFVKRKGKKPYYKIPGKGYSGKSIKIIGPIEELQKLADNLQNFICM